MQTSNMMIHSGKLCAIQRIHENVSWLFRCLTHGGKIPNGRGPKVPATERGMLTRQTTRAVGFQPKAEGSLQWMTMMAWKVSKLETFG